MPCEKCFIELGKTLVPFDAHKTWHQACAQPAHTIAHYAAHNRAQPQRTRFAHNPPAQPQPLCAQGMFSIEYSKTKCECWNFYCKRKVLRKLVP